MLQRYVLNPGALPILFLDRSLTCSRSPTAAISVGPLRFGLTTVPRGENNPGFVDWLYLDNDLRVTRGSKGSLFVHTREQEE